MLGSKPMFEISQPVRYVGDGSPMAVLDEFGKQIMGDHANDSRNHR